MSKRFKIMSVACAFAVLTVFSLFLMPIINGSEAQAASADGGRAIEVTGVGAIKAKPDIAVLNIGVTTNGATTAVQADNTKTMNSVLASVKKQGIDEKDIKTVNYYMNPEYDYTSEKGANRIVGYTVYNVIEVKVRDISKAGEVLSAAVSAGANVNNGISFTLSNVEEYYNQALTQAVANAKSKAETLAKALGVSIGLPSKLTENYSSYSAPMYGNYDSMARTAGAADVSVSQGELEITASISVSYGY